MKSNAFRRIFEGLYVPKMMDERLWFQKFQPLLLWVANHHEGRKLLRLDQSSIKGQIHRIARNLVGHDEYFRDPSSPTGWKRMSVTEFRGGAKYANLIRFQWDWFCALAAEYNLERRAVGVPSGLGFGLTPGLAFTTSTFYPDPHPESTTVDGYQANVDATYVTCRNAASGNAGDDGSTPVFVTHQFRTVQVDYVIHRGFFLFDTAAIDNADTVTAATLSLYKDTTFAVLDPALDNDKASIVSSNPASNTALSTADFDQLGTTKFASDIDLGSVSSGAYNDFALNASGLAAVSVTGVSKFGCRMANDIAGTTPVDAARVTWSSAEETGTTQDPKLVVTHGAAATAAAAGLSLMGCGV